MYGRRHVAVIGVIGMMSGGIHAAILFATAQLVGTGLTTVGAGERLAIVGI